MPNEGPEADYVPDIPDIPDVDRGENDDRRDPELDDDAQRRSEDDAHICYSSEMFEYRQWLMANGHLDESVPTATPALDLPHGLGPDRDADAPVPRGSRA